MYQNNWQVMIQKYNQKHKHFVVYKWHARFHVRVQSCAVELPKAVKLKINIQKERKPLLHRWNSFLFFYSFLDPINRISWLNVNFNFFSSQSLHFNHGSSPEPQNQVKGWFLLYVIISKCATIFQLLTSKNQPLLIRRDTFLVLQNIFHPKLLETDDITHT